MVSTTQLDELTADAFAMIPKRILPGTVLHAILEKTYLVRYIRATRTSGLDLTNHSLRSLKPTQELAGDQPSKDSSQEVR